MSQKQSALKTQIFGTADLKHYIVHAIKPTDHVFYFYVFFFSKSLVEVIQEMLIRIRIIISFYKV